MSLLFFTTLWLQQKQVHDSWRELHFTIVLSYFINLL